MKRNSVWKSFIMMNMTYYFYSEKENLKGLLAYNLYKRLLCDSLEKAVRGKTTGYIYSCEQATGKNINGGYKSNNPLLITGCKAVNELK